MSSPPESDPSSTARETCRHEHSRQEADPGPRHRGVPARQEWAYRLELELHQLTNERQWEYQSGFTAEEDAWTAAIKAKTAHGSGQRVAPAKRTVTEGRYVDFLETTLTDAG